MSTEPDAVEILRELGAHWSPAFSRPGPLKEGEDVKAGSSSTRRRLPSCSMWSTTTKR